MKRRIPYLLAASLLALSPATASGDPTDALVPDAGTGVHAELAELIRGARDAEEEEEHLQAARGFFSAAEASPSLQPYLQTRAALAADRALLASPSTEEADRAELAGILGATRESGALEAGFPEGFFLLARLENRHEGAPSVEVLANAMRRDDRDDICPWLMERLANPHGMEQGHWDLAHGNCIDDDSTVALSRAPYEPTAQARLARAHRLFWGVRFDDALAELDRIPDGALSAVESCRAQFRRARSHVRLRQHGTADPIYRRIVEACTDPANEDERVRSLYAVGNRHFNVGQLDQSDARFTQLFDEYPYRSHADDALFFLARIARRRGHSERELELLHQALTEYPDEDMVHEMAWEVFEPLFRSGQYRQFIDGVTSLPLPPRDFQYFSQGRLEYFVGAAHARLGEEQAAAQFWHRAWILYPFSFYGYVAHLRLLEIGDEPEPLPRPTDDDALVWLDEGFLTTGAGVLTLAGEFHGACDIETARIAATDGTSVAERWRQALLCHKAERYSESHNIARRQIPGRPFAFPLSGRQHRWFIAWPDPFGPDLARAVEARGPSEHGLRVLPSLASAIMREESSFIEDIVSWAGAVGLMQLMPATARGHQAAVSEPVTVESLKRAEINLPVGVDHIAHLSRRYDGHPVLMTAAYNAGGGSVNSWLRRFPTDEIALWVEDITFLETRNYTKRVIGSYGAYQLLYGDGVLDDRVLRPAR